MATLLEVKGTCPKCGNEHTAKAPKGRVTWRGRCPKRGCDGWIVARRFRAEDTPPAGPTAEPATPARKPRKVIKASGYKVDRGQRPGRVQPDTGVQPAGDEPVQHQEPVKSAEPERPAGEREPERPHRADQHETGHTGRRHPYGHLFPGVWG